MTEPYAFFVKECVGGDVKVVGITDFNQDFAACFNVHGVDAVTVEGLQQGVQARRLLKGSEEFMVVFFGGG